MPPTDQPRNLPVKADQQPPPALAKVGKLGDLKDLLKQYEGQFRDVLPKHMTVDRMLRIATAAASRTPKLLECTKVSLLSALHTASQLGLEPNTPLGHAYIIPYWNGKNRTNEAQFQIGYRGLIDLARRGGEVGTIEAHVIHKNDKYRIKFGLDDCLEHEPLLEGDPGDFIAVYAVAKMKDGTKKADVMTKHEVDRIRSKSQSAEKGPWVDHYEEMAKKTVIKRICKTLPMSVELASAIAHDDAVEYGGGASPIETPFGQEIVTEQSHALESASKAEQVRERIRQQAKPEQPAASAPAEIQAEAAEVEAEDDDEQGEAYGADAEDPSAKPAPEKSQAAASAKPAQAQQSTRRVRTF